MRINKRRALAKDVLWILATVGLVAAIARFARGLGATTGLNDATPWGFWIGFDVMGGVALAAGGFTLAATVYIFQLEKYRPLLRPAILTALLGYGTVIVGLLCDLGLPWHIFQPVVSFQHDSALYEVAWCVMLYTSVLALEFAPTLLEHPIFQSRIFRRLYQLLKRLTLPLVIIGIGLSTLHQSSLGSLFLIMPLRVHPLWYSPLLPILFFISAVALGLMMVTLEGFGSAYLYKHSLHLERFSGLGRAASIALWLYASLRLVDLALRGVLPMAFDGSWQSLYFWFEIGISALLPAILLMFRSVRNSRIGLATCAVLTVFGMVLYRLSMSVVVVARAPGTSYFPTWTELAISIGILAGAVLVFMFFVENLKILDTEMETLPSTNQKPERDSTTQVYPGLSLRDTAARRSLVLVLAAGVTVALLPTQVATGAPPPFSPVKTVFGWDKIRMDDHLGMGYVDFNHVDHQKWLQDTAKPGENICVTCHHLSKPGDETTACWECHRDVYAPTSIFDHTLHQAAYGGNASCAKCHTDDHTGVTAKACVECHDTMTPMPNKATFSDLAPGLRDAMHEACIPCHTREAIAKNKPELDNCTSCHKPIQEAVPTPTRR